MSWKDEEKSKITILEAEIKRLTTKNKDPIMLLQISLPLINRGKPLLEKF